MRVAYSSATSDAPTHLILLLHGYMGYSDNMAVMASSLREKFGSEALVLAPNVYALLKSHDGIDVIARRVMENIRATVAAHPTLTDISLIGYSMGGLLARFLAGLLVIEPLPFLGLAPVNLVTVGTPHVGARRVIDTSLSTRFLFLLSWYIGGRSGVQMMCIDRDVHLLALMACRRSAFASGAAKFQRRALYSNSNADHTVPFWTSFVAPWAGSAPSQPPIGRGDEPRVDSDRYPHIAWEGTLCSSNDQQSERRSLQGGDLSAPDGSYAPRGTDLRVTETCGSSHPAERLSLPQVCVLMCLAVFALCVVLPLWFTIVLPLALSVSLCASIGARPPPRLERELSVLQSEAADTTGAGDEGGSGEKGDGDRETVWSSAVLAAEIEATGASCVNEWMAAELNSLLWHKVSVRFSMAVDGLAALQTHGHIIVRNRRVWFLGTDVVRHLADQMRHPNLRRL